MDVRVVLWTCLIMTLLMICTHTLLLPFLFSVLVVGSIPGTDYVIPPLVMLVLYPVLAMVTAYYLSTLQVYIGEPTPTTAPRKPTRARRTATRKIVKKASSAVKPKPQTAL